MTKTVVGLYESITTAQSVVEGLVNIGIGRDDVSLVANDATGEYGRFVTTPAGEMTQVETAVGTGVGVGAAVGGLGGLLLGLGALAIPGIGPVLAAGPLVAALAGAGLGAATGGLIGALASMGIDETDAKYYAEGIRRGGTLVVVNTPDHRVDEVRNVMERFDPIDVEERVAGWQQSGWSGFDESAAPYTAEELTRERATYMAPTTARMTDKGEAIAEVVEEELQVGKREVDKGGVRLHTYVTEKPVTETVQLREENVHVERHAVDRPATSADLEAFEEGTIEVTATAEEAVVSKRARVVEEVAVTKDVSQRTETVQDTVRRKDVDVERVGTTTTARNTAIAGFDTYSTNFRRHYDTNYTKSDFGYNQYVPAYRFGYDLAHDELYRGQTWDQFEAEARERWAEEYTDPWEEFKGAVRYAWEQVKDAVTPDDPYYRQTSQETYRPSAGT
jgi:uncharacterized protein (TIGR02271 family)